MRIRQRELCSDSGASSELDYPNRPDAIEPIGGLEIMCSKSCYGFDVTVCFCKPIFDTLDEVDIIALS